MSLTLIVGFDASAAAAAAVRCAMRLARTADADILAATVYEPAPRIAAKGASARATAGLDEAIREAAERTLSQLDAPDTVLRRIVPAASAAHGLHELAEQEEAALIAVGATHHGRAGRVLMGSVGHRLLHGAPCPVLVVPADADERIGTIAVAYDGGEESKAALAMAADLAGRLGARLRLVTAVPPMGITDLGGALTTYELERITTEERRRALDTAITGLPEGLEADAQVVVGPAGPAITAATFGEADLLVAGSRGYGPLRSVLVGSVSGHLADHASCPVLVVPRGVPASFREERPGAVAAEA
jgi:nucleotide-binding universal stress UspA family protein